MAPASSLSPPSVVIASITKSTGTTLKGAADRPNCGIGMFIFTARETTRSM